MRQRLTRLRRALTWWTLPAYYRAAPWDYAGCCGCGWPEVRYVTLAPQEAYCSGCQSEATLADVPHIRFDEPYVLVPVEEMVQLIAEAVAA